MTLANYLNAQTYNTRKDPNLVINQMDRCQENDSKQDIELEMFLPLNDNDDHEEERSKNDIVTKDNSSPDMCSRGINTIGKSCGDNKHESKADYVIGGGGVEGQKCVLSISTKNKGILLFIKKIH